MHDLYNAHFVVFKSAILLPAALAGVVSLIAFFTSAISSNAAPFVFVTVFALRNMNKHFFLALTYLANLLLAFVMVSTVASSVPSDFKQPLSFIRAIKLDLVKSFLVESVVVTSVASNSSMTSSSSLFCFFNSFVTLTSSDERPANLLPNLIVCFFVPSRRCLTLLERANTILPFFLVVKDPSASKSISSTLILEPFPFASILPPIFGTVSTSSVSAPSESVEVKSKVAPRVQTIVDPFGAINLPLTARSPPFSISTDAPSSTSIVDPEPISQLIFSVTFVSFLFFLNAAYLLIKSKRSLGLSRTSNLSSASFSKAASSSVDSVSTSAESRSLSFFNFLRIVSNASTNVLPFSFSKPNPFSSAS